MKKKFLGMLIIAAIIGFAGVSVVCSQESMTFKGTVISLEENSFVVENEDDEETLETKKFVLTDNTKVFVGKDAGTIDDLEVYDDVVVSYTESGGKNIAVKILILIEDDSDEEPAS